MNEQHLKVKVFDLYQIVSIEYAQGLSQEQHFWKLAFWPSLNIRK